MHVLSSTVLLSVTTLLVHVSARPPCLTSRNGRAVYISTNDNENAVISLNVSKDGLLAAGSRVPTGGAGSNSISGATGELAAPDGLVSQSALTVAGDVCSINQAA